VIDSDKFWSRLEKIVTVRPTHLSDLDVKGDGVQRFWMLGLSLQALQYVVIGWQLLNVFYTLVEAPDFDWAFTDEIYVKAHQHNAGAVGF
jgi:hypothetical protein